MLNAILISSATPTVPSCSMEFQRNQTVHTQNIQSDYNFKHRRCTIGIQHTEMAVRLRDESKSFFCSAFGIWSICASGVLMCVCAQNVLHRFFPPPCIAFNHVKGAVFNLHLCFFIFLSRTTYHFPADAAARCHFQQQNENKLKNSAFDLI